MKRTINNIAFKSAKDAYDHFQPDIPYNIFVSRYTSGKSGHDLFKQAMSSRTVTIHGVRYDSITDAYNKIKPPYTLRTMRQRIKSGKDIFDPVIKFGDIWVNDKRYSSIVSAYHEMKPHCSLATFRNRLRLKSENHFEYKEPNDNGKNC